MTPARFRKCLEVLESLEGSQRGFGRITGWGERASRAWAQGKNEIPQPIANWLENFMEWYATHPIPKRETKE